MSLWKRKSYKPIEPPIEPVKPIEPAQEPISVDPIVEVIEPVVVVEQDVEIVRRPVTPLEPIRAEKPVREYKDGSYDNHYHIVVK